MTPRSRTCLTALALALAAAGCTGDPIEPLPLGITIEADKLSTVPADSITFDIRAQGGILLGLTIEWGDGAIREIDTGGARTVQATLRHAYEHSGVYGVSAAIDDATAGRKTAVLNVTIQ